MKGSVILDCPICGQNHEVQFKTRKQVAIIKDEEVAYQEEYYLCTNTKEDNEFVSGELLDSNLLRARDEYRIKNNLLTSNQIKAIRKKYNLNQAELSLILGWGEVTITRYETKQIQDYSHDKILKTIDSNSLFLLDCFNENKDKLLKKVSNDRCKEIENKIKDMVAEFSLYYLNEQELLAKYMSYDKDNVKCGYKKISISKLESVVNYIANKIDNLYKVKLMKILWYCDFLYFKKYNESLTGLVYEHRPMGALPIGYNQITRLKSISSKVEEFEADDGTVTEGCHIFANDKYDVEPLTKDEKNVIDKVLDMVSGMSTKLIVDKMHQEKAYKNTEENEIISYEYAKDISLKLKITRI